MLFAEERRRSTPCALASRAKIGEYSSRSQAAFPRSLRPARLRPYFKRPRPRRAMAHTVYKNGYLRPRSGSFPQAHLGASHPRQHKNDNLPRARQFRMPSKALQPARACGNKSSIKIPFRPQPKSPRAEGVYFLLQPKLFLNQQCKQRLNGMQLVLALLQNKAVFTVNHVGSHLNAPPRG